MRKAVNGAWAEAAKTAAMPTSAYAPPFAVMAGKKICIQCPKTPPSIAPMYSAGEKMPPELPDPSVNEVVMSLAKMSMSIRIQGNSPLRPCSMGDRPAPSAWGKNSPVKPTAIAPTAGLNDMGNFQSSKTSSR